MQDYSWSLNISEVIFLLIIYLCVYAFFLRDLNSFIFLILYKVIYT